MFEIEKCFKAYGTNVSKRPLLKHVRMNCHFRIFYMFLFNMLEKLIFVVLHVSMIDEDLVSMIWEWDHSFFFFRH